MMGMCVAGSEGSGARSLTSSRILAILAQRSRAKQFLGSTHVSGDGVTPSRTDESPSSPFWRDAKNPSRTGVARETRALPGTLFQRLDFFLQQRSNAMTHQIHLPNTDPKCRSNFLRRPFFANGAIEDLKMFWSYLFLHPRHRGREQILLPLLLPQLIEILRIGIRDALDRRG